MADEPVLLVASRPCDQCLMSSDRIVPSRRATKIIRECLDEDVHFVCHRGSLADPPINLHCRGFYDKFETGATRFARAFNIPIVEIDPDTMEQAT